MPKDKYLIQSPKGETLSDGEKAKLQAALNKIGIPSKDWRFVVLPDQDWKDATQSNSLPHPTDTAFSNLLAKVTYLHQKVLQGSDDSLIRTLAHEQGHARLNTTSEDNANAYMRNSMAEIKKYGRTNNAANAALQDQVAERQNQFQPTSAPIATQLSDAPYSLARSQRP